MAGRIRTERYWRRPLDHSEVPRTRGLIRILTEQCKGCAYCVEYCPLDVLALSDRFNRKGYHPPEVRKPGECVACRLCETLCPEFSIYVVETNDSGGPAAPALGVEVTA